MFYCGIDVAKFSHTATIVNAEGQIVQAAFSFTNDYIGFQNLEQALAAYRGQLQIGLEATGHYWLALYDRFSHQGYPITVLNPLQVHASRRMHVRRRKTDRHDALAIAQFMRFTQPEPSPADLPILVRLRELARFRFHLVQQIGDCKRKVVAVLDRVFPEYERLFSDVFLQSSRLLLQEAVTAEDFATFDLSELEQLLVTYSRGRFGRAKAVEIQTAARRSVGISFLTDAVQVEMRCLLQQIALLQEQVSQVETQLDKMMTTIPQYITTIPGIGLVTGAMLLAEIGNVHRFASSKQLVAYAGIDATVYQTGQFEGDQMHMSKRGSPFLRCALWQAATASLLHNAEMKSFYDRKRAEGKSHGVAMGAVCHKLLGRIYVILKEERPYLVH